MLELVFENFYIVLRTFRDNLQIIFQFVPLLLKWLLFHSIDFLKNLLVVIVNIGLKFPQQISDV